MRRYHMEGDFIFLEQSNEELPGHPENLAGFHGGDFVPALQDRNGMTGPQIRQQLKQERVKVVGQNLGFAVRSDELRFQFAKLRIDVNDLALLFWRDVNRGCFAVLSHEFSGASGSGPRM